MKRTTLAEQTKPQFKQRESKEKRKESEKKRLGGKKKRIREKRLGFSELETQIELENPLRSTKLEHNKSKNNGDASRIYQH